MAALDKYIAKLAAGVGGVLRARVGPYSFGEMEKQLNRVRREMRRAKRARKFLAWRIKHGGSDA